jgi:hypothetical protein
MRCAANMPVEPLRRILADHRRPAGRIPLASATSTQHHRAHGLARGKAGSVGWTRLNLYAATFGLRSPFVV